MDLPFKTSLDILFVRSLCSIPLITDKPILAIVLTGTQPVHFNPTRDTQYILKRNIIWGDAITLKTVGVKPQPILFSE
jgi:hypothetical protein